MPFDSTEEECIKVEYRRKVEKFEREKAMQKAQREMERDERRRRGEEVSESEDVDEEAAAKAKAELLSEPEALSSKDADKLVGYSGYYRLKFVEWLRHWATAQPEDGSQIGNILDEIQAALECAGIEEEMWKSALLAMDRQELARFGETRRCLSLHFRRHPANG